MLGRGFGVGFGHTDVTTEWIFPIAIAVSSLSCFGRFLIETLLVFPRLGVLSIMTREMLSKNLLHWGAIMVIVLIAFGLSFVALAPKCVAARHAPIARVLAAIVALAVCAPPDSGRLAGAQSHGQARRLGRLAGWAVTMLTR